MVGCMLISDTLPVAMTPQMMTTIDEELPIGADLKMMLEVFSPFSEEELEQRKMIRETYLASSKEDDHI